jgi:hypothetical protein
MDASIVEHRMDLVLGRTGGSNQRKKRARATECHEPAVCKLLYTLFAWGAIPAVLVQRIAAAVKEDMEIWGIQVDPLTAHLAGLGTHGAYKSNIRSQLINFFKPVAGLAKPLSIRVPFVCTKSQTSFIPEWLDFPILMVNEVFDALYTHFFAYFSDAFGGGLERFWSQVI